MTQAPATPELVEGDDWALEIAACGFANDSTLPESVRSFIKELWRAYCAMEERADALEAQQARIAELEAVLRSARETILGLKNSRWSEAEGSDEEWVEDIDQALSSQGRHEGGEG